MECFPDLFILFKCISSLRFVSSPSPTTLTSTSDLKVTKTYPLSPRVSSPTPMVLMVSERTSIVKEI